MSRIMVWAGVAIAILLLLWRLDHITGDRDALSSDLSSARERITVLLDEADWLQLKLNARDSVDQQYQETIKNVQSEKDRLLTGIERGDYRVYVRASCPVHAANDTSTAGSIDAGATELDPIARQSYLDFRAGYEQQRQQLIALQQYVTEVCRYDP